MTDRFASLPPGYAVHRIGDAVLVLDRAHASDLVRLRLADPASRRALFAQAVRRGRGQAPSVQLNPETSAVLRRYQHGGVLGPLTGRLFLGPTRALTELEVTARAEAAGAPVPRVLCLAMWPSIGPFWSALIGTREERPAAELLAVLQQTDDTDGRCALAEEVGVAVRRLHQAGVEHHDLQLRNILVTAGAPRRIVLVDLDRAVFHRYAFVPTRRRASNLGRLARSVFKAGLWGARVGPRERAAFLRGYLAGNRRLREELRAWVPLERLKLAAHRATYRPRGIRIGSRAVGTV